MPELATGVVTVVALPPLAPSVGVTPPAPAHTVVLPVPGPPGAPGPAGLGGTVYEHAQTTPSASWLITHPAGRPVTALAVLVGEEEVTADVDHGTSSVTVTFAFPVTGRAYYL